MRALEAAVNEPDAECARALRTPSMRADTDTSDIVKYEHVDPEQVTEEELAASHAETDANLEKQVAVSTKKAALRGRCCGGAAENCGEGLGVPS